MRKEIFYISNLLSLSRLLLTVIAACILLSSMSEKYLITIGLIIVVWISDLLDGFLARKLNEVTELGKMIDPLADKLFIAVLSIILMAQNVIPTWFVLIIVFRDLLIFAGGLYLKYSRKTVLMSNWIGKISVFIIGLTLLFSIFLNHIKLSSYKIFFSYPTENLELYLKILIILSIAMSIVSLLTYLMRLVRLNYK